ncbi:ComEA family DNA-binding protein [Candidatus Sororendozoicomonas aggregata]|uniref:ComEA family DNA-binding protein n=1 Tax=Candidatus Sororendozoicomonas aggregata TaxID=3073239 RepID=UPI002ED4B248
MKKLILTFVAPLVLALPLTVNADKAPSKINVNSASVEELDKGLDGVGERIATEIVKYREEHGPFKTMEDLDKVKYVGSGLLEKNKEKISFEQ